MTTRELWQNIMFYKGHNRMPVIHWDCWEETRARWRKEGMPAYAKEMEGQYPSKDEKVEHR